MEKIIMIIVLILLSVISYSVGKNHGKWEILEIIKKTMKKHNIGTSHRSNLYSDSYVDWDVLDFSQLISGFKSAMNRLRTKLDNRAKIIDSFYYFMKSNNFLTEEELKVDNISILLSTIYDKREKEKETIKKINRNQGIIADSIKEILKIEEEN